MDGVTLEDRATREVEEYPFYSGRLQDIDWQAALQRDELFEDPNFPADVSSLLDATMMHPPSHKKWATYEWRRPSEVYGHGNYHVYKEIDVNDIKQGNCGDCYYLSCLSSIAEYPERIKKIFINEEVNKQGVYAVTFYINNEKRTVVVDDRFPYDTHRERWAFSRCDNSPEIWVLILEKVWAKIFGSY